MRATLCLVLLSCAGLLNAQEKRVTPISAPVESGRRVALVIGNNSYPASPLKNAVNDAQAMARELKTAGFEVIELVDANREQMDTAVNAFVGRLPRGGVALFYYSGHGTQINERNYLAPVDLKPVNAVQVRTRSLDAGEVLEEMQGAGTDLQIMILDACRDNPFTGARSAGQRGLTPMKSGRGAFVAYATAPGMTADDRAENQNGLYTAELLRALRKPGLPLEAVFKETAGAVQKASDGHQVPWVASSVDGTFYFHPPAEPAEPVQETKTGSDVALRAEVEYWASIRDSNRRELFEAYLRRYPNGQYVEIARVRLEALAPSVPAPAAPAPVKVVAAPPPVAPAKAAFERGDRQLANGLYKMAVESYSEAIRLQPDYADAFAWRAMSYRDLGQYNEALADYSRALEIRPDYWPNLDSRGELRMLLKQYQEAVADFTRAIEVGGNHLTGSFLAGVYKNRAEALSRLGDRQHALEDLNRVVELDPYDRNVWQARGKAKAALGDKAGADADYKKARELQ
jgi:tetratricopeptide (TPR) repeat protein